MLSGEEELDDNSRTSSKTQMKLKPGMQDVKTSFTSAVWFHIPLQFFFSIVCFASFQERREEEVRDVSCVVMNVVWFERIIMWKYHVWSGKLPESVPEWTRREKKERIGKSRTTDVHTVKKKQLDSKQLDSFTQTRHTPDIPFFSFYHQDHYFPYWIKLHMPIQRPKDTCKDRHTQAHSHTIQAPVL